MRLCDDVRARKAMRARGERDDDYKENEKRVLKTNQFCATILSSLKRALFKALPSLPQSWSHHAPSDEEMKKQPNLIFFSQPISP